jgi:hypothetical protein
LPEIGGLNYVTTRNRTLAVGKRIEQKIREDFVRIVLVGHDAAGASDVLGNALAAVREVWEPETTGRNLRLIRESRELRGEAKPWMIESETELANRAR